MPDVNNGTYVSLGLTTRSGQRLQEWCEEVGIKNHFESPDFHITVCYSKRPLHYTPLERLPPLPVKPVGFSLFGKEKDYLVLRVQSALAKNRYEYAKLSGAVSDFPDYKPHISLAKDSGISSTRDLPPFEELLFVNRESMSILDNKYKPGSAGYADGVLIRQVLTASDGQWVVQWLDGNMRKTKRFDNEETARAWYERIRYSSVLKDVKIYAPWSF